jgi:hypothetical protein
MRLWNLNVSKLFKILCWVFSMHGCNSILHTLIAKLLNLHVFKSFILKKKNIKHDCQFHDHIKILLAKFFNLHNDYNSYIIHSTQAIGANLATFKN